MKPEKSTSQPTSPRVERYEAIWLDGRVPNGYWDQFKNRRLYLRWLGQRLGFRKMESWYRITTNDFKRNRGATVLATQWGSSAIAAVKECFPDYDWKDWLFGNVPRHFWPDPTNRHRYMRWLGQELGIRCPADWYGVSNHDFAKHQAGALLLYYDSTISLAIMDYLPNYDWKEWMFDKTPKRFWQKKANRRRYMTWLGERLGFKSARDWYSVLYDDFVANYGTQFMKIYHKSPIAALQEYFPRHTWNEWMFIRVPAGYWDEPENRKRYMRWLAKKLNVKRPSEWHKVRWRDLNANCAGGLLVEYRSQVDLLQECIPEVQRPLKSQ